MSESETPFPGRHKRGSTTNRKTLCVVQQRDDNNNNNNVSHDIYNQNIIYSGWGGGKRAGLLFACKRIGYIRNDSRPFSFPAYKEFQFIILDNSTFIIYEVGKASVLFFPVS